MGFFGGDFQEPISPDCLPLRINQRLSERPRPVTLLYRLWL
jgi:hypothetical protein